MVDSTELTEFIKSVCKSIIDARPEGFYIFKPIEFDLAIISSSEEGTKFNIRVASKEDIKSEEIVSRVHFKYNIQERLIR